MKSIKVVAAIIVRNRAVLACQRGNGRFKDKWEFPGGKLEAGESPEQALVREIREELDATIAIERPVIDIAYDYDTFHLDMRCYLCTLEGGYTLIEHEAARWLDAAHLDAVDWLPANAPVIDAIREQGIV